MKIVKSVLSFVLAISMVLSLSTFGMLPVASAEASKPIVSATTEEVQDGVYKTTVHVSWDSAVKLFNIVLSYDTEVVVPVEYVIDVTSYRALTITDDSQTTSCFKVSGLYDNSNHYSPLAIWRVDEIEKRAAFSLALYATAGNSNITRSCNQDMFDFYFQLLDGKSESDMEKGTLRFETDTSEGSMLSLLYSSDTERKNNLRITDSNDNVIYYEDGGITWNGLTYPNSDTAKLASIELSGYPNTINVSAAAEAQKFSPALVCKDTVGDTITAPQSIVFSITPEVDGSTILFDTGTGELAVTRDALRGIGREIKYTIMASDGTVSSNAVAVTINRPSSILSYVKLEPSSVTVHGTYGATVKPIAIDQFGYEMDVSGFSVTSPDGDVRGDDVTYEDGMINVSGKAESGEYMVTVYGTSTGAKLTVTRNESVASDIKLVPPETTQTLIIPDSSGNVPAGYRCYSDKFVCEVYDQFGELMTEDLPDIAWSLVDENGNAVSAEIISIDKGIVTVTEAAKSIVTDSAGAKFTLSASFINGSGEEVKSAASDSGASGCSIIVKRSAQSVSALEVYRDNTLLASVKPANYVSCTDTVTAPLPGGNGSASFKYSVRFFDQYGVEMDSSDAYVIWGGAVIFGDTTGKISFDNSTSTLTVYAGAANGSTATFSVSANGVTAQITVNVTDLEADWSGVSVKSGLIYGTTNAETVTLPGSGTATVGNITVKGSFSVKSGDTIQGAGERTVTVAFKADDSESNGIYRGIEMTKEYTVRILRRSVAVTISSKEKTYGEENPGLSFTVTSGELAAGDTLSSLDITLSCEATRTSSAGTVAAITGVSNSSDYNVTFTNGTLTVRKATITGYATTLATKTIASNSSVNTSADNLKTYMDLPSEVTVEYKGGTATLPITWSNSSESYNPKGGTYTYKGTVNPGTNFNSYSTALTAKLIVTKISITSISGMPDDFTVTKAKVNSAGKLTDTAVGFPVTVTLTFDGGASQTDAISAYDCTISTLKSAANNVTESLQQSVIVTLTGDNFPAWATLPSSMPKTVVTIIEKNQIPAEDIVFAGNVTVAYGDTNAETTVKKAKLNASSSAWADATVTYSYLDSKGNELDAMPTSVGEYTVTATYANGDYAGSKSIKLTITPRSAANGIVVTLTPESFTYNGQSRKPETVTVKYGNTTLTEGVDYTLSYSTDTVNVGEAAVTVTLKGNYTGTLSCEYTIEKASIEDMVPTITGDAKAGGVLSASITNVSNDQVTWKWYCSGQKIGEGAYIAISDAQSGAEITVIAEANGENYTGVSQTSEPVTVMRTEITGSISIVSSGDKFEPGDTLHVDVSNVYPKSAQENYKITWYPTDGDSVKSGYQVPDNATGNITVTLRPDSDKFTGALTASVEIGKSCLEAADWSIGSISGIISTGTVLTLDYSGYLNLTSGEDYNIQWTADGADISGATTASYMITSNDLGKTISATVIGTGDYTGTINIGRIDVPADCPSAPVVTAETGNKKTEIKWTTSDNGSPILGYTLVCSYEDGLEPDVKLELSPNITSYLFEDLINGVKYTFTVTATNSLGSRTGYVTTIPGSARIDSNDEENACSYTTVQNADGSVTTTTKYQDTGVVRIATVKTDGQTETLTEVITTPTGKTNAVTETVKKFDGSSTSTTNSATTKNNGTVIEAKTETVTHSDGSAESTTTSTATEKNGNVTEAVTETITNSDGSAKSSTQAVTSSVNGTVTKSQTETITNSDGSSSSITNSVSTTATGTVTKSNTETKTSKDGSSRSVTKSAATASDGTVTESEQITETNIDGSATATTETITTKPDGTVTTLNSTTEIASNGTSVTTITSSDGITGTVEMDDCSAVTRAKIVINGDDLDTGAVVTIPVVIGATDNFSDAAEIKITVPFTISDPVKVEVPVENLTSGTVAAAVAINGEEEIISKSAITNDGISLSVRNSMTIKIANNAMDFNDISDHWSHDAVDFASSHNLFNGTGNNEFSPDVPMNRAMLATVLFRLEGAVAEGVNPFEDVENDTWYSDSVIWASANGIVQGTGNGFEPLRDITRQEIVVMLYRYANMLGMDTSSSAALESYEDSDEIADWAIDAMEWAVSVGLMTGRTATTLVPQGSATRAEVATLMQRLVNLMLK